MNRLKQLLKRWDGLVLGGLLMLAMLAGFACSGPRAAGDFDGATAESYGNRYMEKKGFPATHRSLVEVGTTEGGYLLTYRVLQKNGRGGKRTVLVRPSGSAKFVEMSR